MNGPRAPRAAQQWLLRATPLLPVLLLLGSCDDQPGVGPDARDSSGGSGPVLLSRRTIGPSAVSSGAGPSLHPGAGQAPHAGRSSSGPPAVRLSPFGASASVSGSSGVVNYVLWQNTSTGNRGFWPLSGASYTGGWEGLGEVPVAWDIAGMADFTGDGMPDVVWQNTSTGIRGAWPMSGTTYPGGWVEFGQVPVEWDVAAVADFTGDGKADILWQNRSTGVRGIWEMNGGAFTGNWHSFGQVPLEWNIAAAADFTSDGKTDILWENTSTGARGIWPLNGTVYTGGWHSIGQVPVEWRIGAAGDLTGDGKPDIVWQNLSTGMRGVWPMKGPVYEGGWYEWGTVPLAWSVAALTGPGAIPPRIPLGRISTGLAHACGITSAGAAYCWGNNASGQLGNGTTADSYYPVPVMGGLTFSSISAGASHTCGITSAGAAYCWGSNYYGQLGNGTTTDSSAPVAVTGGLTFSFISAGFNHTCGVGSSGAGYCWGSNYNGQLGNGTTTNSSAPVAVGPRSSTGGLTFTAVSAGSGHTCGISPAGAAYCWGWNHYGQLGNGTTTDSSAPVAVTGGLAFTSVSAGHYQTCGISSAGAAYCWGSNHWGQVGNATVASFTSPTAVTGGLTFSSVSAGGYHTCGISSAGAAYCWGDNSQGQLGTGTKTSSSTPAAVVGGLTFSSLGGGYSHTCGLTSSGASYCWGQLSLTTSPVRVPGPVASVTVSPSSAEIVAGKTVQLSATLRDEDGIVITNRSPLWSSSDNTIASVHSITGLVTGSTGASGKAIVTAAFEGKSGSAEITVLPSVHTVTVAPAATSVALGGSHQLTAILKDANGNVLSGRSVSWSINTSTAMTVDPSGLVTSTGGTIGSLPFTVTASSEGKTGQAHVGVVSTSYNLMVDAAYITQSVQWYNGSVPLAAGRPGYLRVFVKTNGESGWSAPAVRARLYHGSMLVTTFTVPPKTASSTIYENDLSSSWNVSIPGWMIQPGLRVIVDLDPENAIYEANEGDNTFTLTTGSSGALDVRSAPVHRIRFIPVRQAVNGYQGNVTDTNKGTYLALAQKISPLPGVDADVGPVYTTDAPVLQSDNVNGAWGTILNEVEARRVAEGTDRYYYGVVRTSYTSGISGLGYVPGKAAIGWDLDLSSGGSTYAHEAGHNWGRLHAPCGSVSDSDPNFPNSTGVIEAYGMDVGAGTLISRTMKDVMGYCTDKWIHPYTYTGILDHRSMAASLSVTTTGSPQPALLVWGRIGKGGVVLEPAFEITTRPALPSQAGPYRIEGLDARGARVFSFTFAGSPVDHAPGERSFAFAVPLSEKDRSRVARLELVANGRRAVVTPAGAAQTGQISPMGIPPRLSVAPGVQDGVSLRWDAAAYPMAMVRDSRTGEVLAFARGGDGSFIAPPAAELEVIFSNGVQSRRERIAVAPR